MRFSSAFFAATVVLPVFAVPTLVPITKRGGTLVEDSYIITLKDEASQEAFLDLLKKGWTNPDSTVTQTYTVINGVAAHIKPVDLPYVRGMNEVASIEQDQVLSLPDHEGQGLPPVGGTQPNPPAGNDVPGSYGKGVTVYGIDTGIYVDHECFRGRARWGWSAYECVDDHGHGTHTAGTAIGKGFGVATEAQMVAVKVMNAAGTGFTKDIIKGLDYACNDIKKTNKLAIVTMSIGGSKDDALDQAVRNCIGWGVHFTIAAGNDNADAKDYSPARVQEANTIGAVDTSMNNQKASFSNWGGLIDVWAPGVNIKSAWIGLPNSEKTISGTSMATPYVAGVLSVALSRYGQMSPPALSQQLQQHATNSVTFSANDTKAEQESNHLFAMEW